MNVGDLVRWDDPEDAPGYSGRRDMIGVVLATPEDPSSSELFVTYPLERDVRLEVMWSGPSQCCPFVSCPRIERVRPAELREDQ
ncbi:MAG TPA: hypothetical protein EYG51_22240 [Pseudomonadales bacterium]|nr:hypothetical protein [Pseudomonadales bacterium]